MGKKDLLAKILYGTGATRIILFLNQILCRRLLILAYHRIHDIEPLDEDSFTSDIELMSASKNQFDWQIGYLKKYYSIATFETYSDILKENKVPQDIVIITFDDGFRDNYEIAFPVLRKHGVPAVFYISVDYIGSKEPFWFEYVVSVIRQIPREYLEAISEILLLGEFGSNREKLTAEALNILKKTSNETRLSVISNLNEYCKQLGLVITSSDSQAMTWEQVLEMSQCGMEIGSHTLSHPVLANLARDEIDHELSVSKILIEQRINKPCYSLSYPNGGSEDFNEMVLEAVNDANYEFACSYIPGSNEHKRLKKYQLKRLHVERYTGKSYFASMLALPGVFG